MNKILISHRGNINNISSTKENSPDYIDAAIDCGFNVEVDVWCFDGNIFLGHDNPEYNIQIDWILQRSNTLWVHCKNLSAIEFMQKYNYVNYFWHENDAVTLTSLGYIWAYPGKQPIKNSIAVLPEIYNDDVSNAIGICSDYIEKYKGFYDSNSNK
jgi:hypothetical protein